MQIVWLLKLNFPNIYPKYVSSHQLIRVHVRGPRYGEWSLLFYAYTLLSAACWTDTARKEIPKSKL